MPLLFMVALIAAGATTWVVSGGGASMSGLILGGLIFILIWSVAGPLWFDLHLGLALNPRGPGRRVRNIRRQEDGGGIGGVCLLAF